MKKIYTAAVAALLAAATTSCSDWLDITPEGQVEAESMFADEAGYEEALAGVYQSMGSTYTYGKNLITMPDAIAQYWLLPGGTETLAPFKKFDFTHSDAEDIIDNAWQYMYTSIANANLILSYLGSNTPLSTKTYNVIRGEALGLRAFMHLDLLRLFGPQPDDLTAEAIPYRTQFDNQTAHNKTVGGVLDAAEADLLEARELLANDPIKEYGRKNADLENYNTGLAENFRGCRMNYYAVCATLARLYMWKGDKTTAAKYAQEVIDANKTFWLVKKSDINNNYLFQCEVIFGLYLGSNIQSGLTSVFGVSTSGKSDVLTVSSGFVNSMFLAGEGATDDYRNASYMWNSSTGTEGKATNKYKWSIESSVPAKNDIQPIVPLLRLSEMYYIVAEANAQTPDNGVSRSMLNDLRQSRNLSKLSKDEYSGSEIVSLILADARREFVAEGQLFYMFKRMNRAITSESGNIDINKITWKLPIPKTEDEYNK